MKSAAARKNELSFAESQTTEKQSEYTVYIFHDPGKHRGEAQNWEMKHSTTNLRAALKRARVLHNTQRYTRVEVKGRYFDIRSERKIDRTLKTFGRDRSIPWEVIAQFLAVMGLGAMAAFCSYAMLTHMGI